MLNLIGAAGDNVTIRLPRKKMTFCFNHPRDSNARSRSQKMGSLKDFEVCSVLKKESASNGQKSYQSDGRGYLPKV
jgi:hypothetical protein